ncbi:hypothetical protein LCGC14_0371810 [marine sediment metagenome]|uniref:Uncharacterized protein n=1 Tax=marine sediment metagenome TaxID=412755 RepID=A0A0F9TB00_9ZZZZ
MNAKIPPPEQVVSDLCVKIQALKRRIKNDTEEMDRYKEEVRGVMIDNEMNYLTNEIFESVKLVIPKSFDIAMLKMYHKDLAKMFIKEEIKTTTIDVISKDAKKIIKEKHPEAWEDITAEGTPRLNIKER